MPPRPNPLADEELHKLLVDHEVARVFGHGGLHYLAHAAVLPELARRLGLHRRQIPGARRPARRRGAPGRRRRRRRRRRRH